MKINNLKYHLLALSVAIIWGTTYVSTKVLITHGLAPKDIFFYRFLLAYIAICFFKPFRLFARNIKDELMLVGCGIGGGSLYFLAENTALGITLATNVALIISAVPIVTAILSHIALKGERLNANLVTGSIIAFIGVAFVIFNGSFILKINPLGDILTFVAVLSWSFYTIILKKLGNRYNALFITRKVFFYGLLTISPIFIFQPLNTNIEILLKPVVWSNLLFLGLIASFACFMTWNLAVKQLGSITTTNYVYITPLITFITSVIVIHEPVTAISVIGACFIILGVYFAGRPKRILAKVS